MGGSSKRIIHITNDLGIGGVQRLIISLLEGLKRDGFIPYLATVSGEGEWMEKVREMGVKLRYFPCIRRFHSIKWIDPFQVFLLSWWIRKEGIDLVHTHLFLGGLFGRAAALLSGKRVIIHSEHSTYIWKRSYHILIDRFLSIFTRRIITPSKAVMDFTIAQEGINRGRFITIYNGTRIKGRMKKIDGYVVGNIGRFVKGKGQLDLLEAIPYVVKEMDGVSFIFIGDGPLREAFVDRAKRLGVIDWITLTGMVDDIERYISWIQILVHTPEWEGFGLCIIEAMSYGIPVVAYRVGGIKEIVEDGRTGILIEPGDIEGLGKAIVTLLRDRKMREEMGAASIQMVRERFDISSMVKRVESLYDEVLMNVKG